MIDWRDLSGESIRCRHCWTAATRRWFTTQRRDLLDEHPGAVECLWELPGGAARSLARLPDGSWPRSDVNKHPAINVNLVETWRNLHVLVAQYGFDQEHPALRTARRVHLFLPEHGG